MMDKKVNIKMNSNSTLYNPLEINTKHVSVLCRPPSLNSG